MCLPNFTKRVVPQFDILTLSTQIFGLLLSLVLLYYYNINSGLLHFIKVKKLRFKKVKKANKSIIKASSNFKAMEWSSNINYQFYLQSKPV